MNDLAWLDAYVRVRFVHAAQGRLEPGEAVPRFWLGRSRLGNLWRMRADLDTAQVGALARVAARELALTAPRRAPERLPRFAELSGDDAPQERVLYRVDARAHADEVALRALGARVEVAASASGGGDAGGACIVANNDRASRERARRLGLSASGDEWLWF